MKLFETNKKSGLGDFAEDVLKFSRIKKKIFKNIVLFLIIAVLIVASVIFLPRIKYYFLPVETLTIDISHINYQKLAYKRKDAIEKDYLLTGPDDYVPAGIRYKKQSFKVDIRLKGDLISHLDKNKWSFRVKLKGDNSIWGIKKFSLQSPGQRGDLAQWIFHQALKNEGLIALRYKFVNVIVNGKNWGLYALEEHFDKYLIENNKRREGPILKLDEDMLWRDRYQNDFSHQTDFQDYNALNVDAFKKNLLFKNPSLYKAYISGFNLLEAFRNKKLTTHEVFDVEKLAKYFAIADLTGASHATRWHNIRFYYNPVTARLEPIGFDAGCDEIHYLLGSLRVQYFVPGAFNKFLSLFFEDEVFFAEYISQLERISQVDYLDSFFKGIDPKLRANQHVLEQNLKKYKFSKDVYYRNQKRIKNILTPQKAVNAHYESRKGGVVTLSIGNILSLPVEIDHLEYGDDIILEAKTCVVLKARRGAVPIQYVKKSFYASQSALPLEFDASKCKIFYKLLGASKTNSDPIFLWPGPDSKYLVNEIFNDQRSIKSFEFIQFDKTHKNFVVNPGFWVVEKDIIVPKGYKLIITGGTNLNLINNSKIISFSPISFIGSEENPVVIISSDQTGQGLAVLQAKERSFLEHVTFNGLSNPRNDLWDLTGAITFYESPVSIKKCKFLDNRSEDGLNIVRGEFSISESLFKSTLSDALDIDFGKGEIINTFFADTGNDAIDVSGTLLGLRNIHVRNAGDKGISVGEESKVDLADIFIDKSKIGVAVKDFSEIRGERIQINDSLVGITLYQKKAEFGPALAHLKEVKTKNVKHAYFLEDASELKINRKRKRTDQDVFHKLKQKLLGL